MAMKKTDVNAAEQEEKFDTRDIIQTAVGSFAGALTYAYQTDVISLSSQISAMHVLLLIILGIILSFLIAYSIGVRRLGKKKMKMALGFIPVRTAVHYISAAVFSVVLLYLLGINTASTPFALIVKRVVLLALPATVFGSAVDLIGSQKE